MKSPIQNAEYSDRLRASCAKLGAIAVLVFLIGTIVFLHPGERSTHEVAPIAAQVQDVPSAAAQQPGTPVIDVTTTPEVQPPTF